MPVKSTSPAPRSAEESDWQKRYFGYLPPRRSPAAVRAIVDGLDRYADLSDRARVLDFGCGTGEQTLEIARRGCRVLGVDPNAPRLGDVRASSADKSLFLHFMRTDLRSLGIAGDFHVAANLHNAMGLGERDDLKCLLAVHRALRPQGKLVLDLPSRDWLARHMDAGSASARSAFDLVTGRLSLGASSLRVYTLTQAVQLLSEARFAFFKAYGGWDGEDFGLDSMRMIVLAEKVADEPPPRSPSDDLPRAIKIKGRRR